jgi:hypothetical protein
MTDDRGFAAVVKNRNFFTLWMAQIISQTAQNGIHFVQIVLIETLTRSTAHMAIMILSFSLPAVLLSSVAGIACQTNWSCWAATRSAYLPLLPT